MAHASINNKEEHLNDSSHSPEVENDARQEKLRSEEDTKQEAPGDTSVVSTEAPQIRGTEADEQIKGSGYNHEGKTDRTASEDLKTGADLPTAELADSRKYTSSESDSERQERFQEFDSSQTERLMATHDIPSSEYPRKLRYSVVEEWFHNNYKNDLIAPDAEPSSSFNPMLASSSRSGIQNVKRDHYVRDDIPSHGLTSPTDSRSQRVNDSSENYTRESHESETVKDYGPYRLPSSESTSVDTLRDNTQSADDRRSLSHAETDGVKLKLSEDEISIRRRRFEKYMQAGGGCGIPMNSTVKHSSLSSESNVSTETTESYTGESEYDEWRAGANRSKEKPEDTLRLWAGEKRQNEHQSDKHTTEPADDSVKLVTFSSESSVSSETLSSYSSDGDDRPRLKDVNSRKQELNSSRNVADSETIARKQRFARYMMDGGGCRAIQEAVRQK